jgi:hypothetical protein
VQQRFMRQLRRLGKHRDSAGRQNNPPTVGAGRWQAACPVKFFRGLARQSGGERSYSLRW